MEVTKSSDGRSTNAYRHGLTGHIQIRTRSEQAAYDEFCRGIHQSLAPVGALEISLAQSIADDRWRLHRAAALESDIFALVMSDSAEAYPAEASTGSPESDEAMAQARAWLSRGKSLNLLGLYENRLNRHLEKNMAELRRLQADRQAAFEKALQEAELLALLAESDGQAFDPVEDAASNVPSNYVFSPSEFSGRFTRNRRLARAKNQIPAPGKLPRIAA